MTEIDVMLQVMDVIRKMQESNRALLDCIATVNKRIDVVKEIIDAVNVRLDVIENIQTRPQESAFDEMMSRTHSMAQKIRQRQDD